MPDQTITRQAVRRACRMHPLVLLAALVAFPVGRVSADQPEAPAAQATLPDVVVEAFQIPRPIDRSTQAVSLITRDEIRARRPASVFQLLQSLPGIHVDRVGGPGGIVNTYVRGADPNHTLVLVDGIRANDPTDPRGGSYDLTSIAPEDVERIEVLRGAGGAMFGADAMGGVINIVLRRPSADGLRGAVTAGAGQQGYGSARALLDASAGSLAGNIGGGTHRDGEAGSGGTVDQSSAFASLRARPLDRLRTRLHARRSSRESTGFPEFSGGVALAANRALEWRDADENQVGADAQLAATGDIGVYGRAGLYRRQEDRRSPAVSPGPGGFVPASETHSDFERSGGALTVEFRRLPALSSLNVGIEDQRESGEARSLTYLPDPIPGRFDLRRSSRGLYGELTSHFLDPVTVVLAARRDRIDGFGSRLSTSGGLNWRMLDATVLRLHASEGFKPPSFYALGDPLVGNPLLSAESSRTVEAGVEHTRGRTRVQATLFRNRFENLIDFDPQSFRLVNRREVDSRGAELQLAWSATHLAITGTYTYLDIDVEGTTDTLRNRPRHRASAVADARLLDRLRGVLTVTYVGATSDFSVPTGPVQLGSQLRTDFALTYEIQRVALTLAVDNVGDRSLESYVGFEDPGRRVRMNAALRL